MNLKETEASSSYIYMDYKGILKREINLEKKVPQVSSEWDTKLYKLLDTALASLKLLADEELYEQLSLLKKREIETSLTRVQPILHKAASLYNKLDSALSAEILCKEWDSLANIRILILKKKMKRKKINKALAKLEGRLYPLQKGKYNEFANKVWMNRGSPKFGKERIDGALWGEPITLTNSRFGWEKIIKVRLIGCKIIKGKAILSIKDSAPKKTKHKH